MIVLTASGSCVAGYLTYVHYSGITPPCSIKGDPCSEVQKSRYSELAGVPVALIGLIGYVAILVSLLAPEDETGPVRDGGADPRRLRVQPVSDLSRAVHDPQDLRVVRLQRGDHDDLDVPVDLALPARRCSSPRGRRRRASAGRGASSPRRRSGSRRRCRAHSRRASALAQRPSGGPRGLASTSVQSRVAARATRSRRAELMSRIMSRIRRRPISRPTRRGGGRRRPSAQRSASAPAAGHRRRYRRLHGEAQIARLFEMTSDLLADDLARRAVHAAEPRVGASARLDAPRS